MAQLIVITPFGRTLVNTADAAAARTILGLGSAALQASSAFDTAGAASAALVTAEAYTDSALVSYVPITRTVNGQALSANVTVTTITGNAGTATALATGRTISISGDITYTSPSFDGSGNVTAAGTLATVNSNVGSFTNASITVNAKGLITAASSGAGGGVALGDSPTWTGIHTFTPGARSSGVAPYFTINAPSDTALTASTEALGISIVGATRQHSTGDITLQREVVISAPTYSFVGASIITTAVTLDITGAPIAGTNATLSTAGRYAARINVPNSGDNGLLITSNGNTGSRNLIELRNSGDTVSFSLDRGGNMTGPSNGATWDVGLGGTVKSSGGTGTLGGAGTNRWASAFIGTTSILSQATGTTPLTIGGIASQSATLVQLQGVSSTSTTRAQAEIDAVWNDSTDATRIADLVLRAYNVSTAREGIRIRGGASNVQLGFNAATPISKPTVTGSRGANAALASLLTALANYGLITDSSS